MPKAECMMSLAEVTSLREMHGGCIYYCFSSGPVDPAHSVQVCDLIRGFKKHISSVLRQTKEETKPTEKGVIFQVNNAKKPISICIHLYPADFPFLEDTRGH